MSTAAGEFAGITRRRRASAMLSIAMAACLGGTSAQAATVLTVDFDTDEQGFAYQDDAFRSTSEPNYAAGTYDALGGMTGGGLRVDLGGINETDIVGMSGGWSISFVVAVAEPLELSFHYRLTQTNAYEDNEFSQVMVRFDGAAIGTGGADFVAEVKGDGNSGSSRSTGWRVFRAQLGTIAVGTHLLTLGGYNNQKTSTSEATEVLLDDVLVATAPDDDPNLSVQAIVAELSLQQFEQNVIELAAFGTRYWNQPGNADALDWIEARLQSYGYATVRHAYSFSGQTRENVYVTKIGATAPQTMYLVSAHMDSYNTQSSNGSFAPGADDDGSGTALVLEAARVFAPASVVTDTSIRFILWNNEETGLNGSAAYVSDRRTLQGVESPSGSGLYPEPTWLGILQHDMILFDHGLPPQPLQIPTADVDIEYQSGASLIGESIALATAVHAANLRYSTDYPAEVSADMNFTDSKSFQSDCPSISVRENRRVAEIGNGANPNWHKNTDVVATYSAADFLLGFNAVQMTVGALAELSGAAVVLCGDGIVPAAEACDDGDTEPGDGCDGNCQIEQGFTCAGEPSVCAICRTDGLRFDDPGNAAAFSWVAPASSLCAQSFDVARGNLSDLWVGGTFAEGVCLADDLGTQQFTDTSDPPADDGYWYLTRIDGDSWEALGSAAAVARDASLAACP